jgi:hypothetical protein
MMMAKRNGTSLIFQVRLLSFGLLSNSIIQDSTLIISAEHRTDKQLEQWHYMLKMEVLLIQELFMITLPGKNTLL